MSTRQAIRAHLSDARKAISGNERDANDFLAGHPFFGMEDQYPKTVQKVKDLAEQIRAGLISEEDADEQAYHSLVTEDGAPDDGMDALLERLLSGKQAA